MNKAPGSGFCTTQNCADSTFLLTGGFLLYKKNRPHPWIADRGGKIWTAAHIHLWEKIDKQRFI